MDDQIVRDFRRAHEADNGMRVLADTLTDLGFFDVTTSNEQATTRNYAVRVIEKMGVRTHGQRYQLALGVAKLLQEFIPELEE